MILEVQVMAPRATHDAKAEMHTAQIRVIPTMQWRMSIHICRTTVAKDTFLTAPVSRGYKRKSKTRRKKKRERESDREREREKKLGRENEIDGGGWG